MIHAHDTRLIAAQFFKQPVGKLGAIPVSLLAGWCQRRIDGHRISRVHRFVDLDARKPRLWFCRAAVVDTNIGIKIQNCCSVQNGRSFFFPMPISHSIEQLSLQNGGLIFGGQGAQHSSGSRHAT